MPPEPYVVEKIFNNNVVLAKHEGIEKILIQKGLGFGKREGQTFVAATSFDKVFTIESKEASDKFNQVISQVDASLVGICEEIIYLISAETNQPVGDEVHVRFIDHIAFAVYRLKNNDKIENPFQIEIETLYPKEMAIAEKAAAVLAKNIGIAIPDGEIGFIALHIHTLKNKGKLSNTVKYTYLCNTVMEIIEDELEVEIDRKSIDYARFITHIRFAVERIFNKVPIRNDLLTPIKKMYKSSYKIAKKVAQFLEDEIQIRVSEEETGYIAMHIERLRNSSSFVAMK